MVKAIEAGIPKMRIEEAAARKQARIDAGVDTIVGVNAYRLEKEAPLATLEVDNSAVREAQIRRLEQLKAERNPGEVECALAALTECARTGEGNLLALAVDAARKRATLGEISDALEKVYGRYQAVIRSISGVYSAESQMDKEFQNARQHGRRVRQSGRPPPANPGGQDGAGRPRPRRQGHLHGVRRPRLRRRYRTALPDAARGGASRRRKRRSRARRLHPCRQPQNAGAAGHRGTQKAWSAKIFWWWSAGLFRRRIFSSSTMPERPASSVPAPSFRWRRRRFCAC